MPNIEVHADSETVHTLGEYSDGKPAKWAVGEVVPHIVALPDALAARYYAIMDEFWSIQRELGALYDQGVPANAIRPQSA